MMKFSYKLCITIVFLLAFGPAWAQNPQEKAALKFFDHIKTGKYGQAALLVDSSLQGMMNEQVIHQLWVSIQKQSGAFKKDSGYIAVPQDSGVSVYIGCIFEKANWDLQIPVNENSRITGIFLNVPRTKRHYKKPSYDKEKNYTEQLFYVKNGKWVLRGTLTLPKKTDKAPPVIVFGHGSGPNNRDEEAFGNKMFRDLAVGLAAKGIASYRFDKRTYSYKNGAFNDPDSFSMWELCIDDILKVSDSLRNSIQTDPNRIYFFGHSLTAHFAPRIDSAGNFRGVILAAGNFRPLDSLVYDQYAYLAKFDETGEVQKMYAEFPEKMETLRHYLNPYTSPSVLPLPFPPAFWLDYLSYSPAKVAMSTSTPYLFLQGEQDYQVPVQEFLLWKQYLAGRKNTEFESFKKLNHHLMPGDISKGADDYDRSNNVDYAVVKRIAEFVEESEGRNERMKE